MIDTLSGEFTSYVYDEQSDCLRCVECGGLGNAVVRPFVDSRFGYIPSHAHKHGCSYAAELVVEEKKSPRDKIAYDKWEAGENPAPEKEVFLAGGSLQTNAR